MGEEFIAFAIAPRIRLLLLLHVSKITHLYFSFFLLGLKVFIYFSSHGSSLISLSFPPSFAVYRFCLCSSCVVYVCSDLVCMDVCSDLVFGDVCSILLSTMRSDTFCSLLLLIVAADGRVLVICRNLYHRWTSWKTDVILIICHN